MQLNGVDFHDRLNAVRIERVSESEEAFSDLRHIAVR